MSRPQTEKQIVPSVLDRLIDDAPDSKSELPPSPAQALRELKQAVRRDLEDLLNTRRRARSFPSPLTQLQDSLVNYGIPDFTGTKMASHQDRLEFRRLLEEIIRRSDPRFRSVRVQLLENKIEEDRTLHFRIDALLEYPVSETVVFDTSLEPSTGTFEVTKVT